MLFQPLGERAEVAEALRVFNGGVDLQPVANDAFVAHQALAVVSREARHALDMESGECLTKGLALFQNREPREPGLIDLQHQPLEEAVVIANRKAVLAVVIRPVDGMIVRKIAVTQGVILSGAKDLKLRGCSHLEILRRLRGSG